MLTTGERNFERDERQVRLSVAYAKLDDDMQRARQGVPARLDEVIPPQPKRKEPPQCS